MNKKLALLHLLEESVLFTNDVKEQIRSKVEYMPDEQLDVIGKLFAYEQKALIENNDEILNQVSQTLSTAK